MKPVMLALSALSFLSLNLLTACGPTPGTAPSANPSTSPTTSPTTNPTSSPTASPTSNPSSAPATVQVTQVSGCAQPANNLVSNGDFETPSVGQTWRVFTGSTLTGWQIPTGNIELVGTAFEAAEGVQSLDLVGSASGEISQSVATQAGTAYMLSFCLAGNPGGDPKVKELDVLWNGTSIATLSFDTTGKTTTAMGWQGYRIEIPAGMTSGAASLGFRNKASGADTYFGPMLDNIGVSAL
ncbi:MAG: hypothetical protein CVV27_13360 [Candidatus Melainabacteria bacterium HGW-Melainabacteria-1]|nr:MAG: hypothetical protein CVV27_13360 [Candidatus Melainabacteria bacterium HGW-Melainabacteria-1]